MPAGGGISSAAQSLVYKVTFDKICSDYLLVSGEKAYLVKVLPNKDGTVVRKHLS